MMGLYGYGYGHGMMGGIGGFFMFFVMLMFLVIAVLSIFALVKYLRVQYKNDFSPNPSLNALQILNDRYAMGEISDEEYSRKKLEIKKQ